jgi:hypothetical protein
MSIMLHLDAWMRLKRWCDGFERGVELGDACLRQQVHEMQAGEHGLVLGIGDDEFVIKVNCFGLRNVSLERVHVANFKTKKRAELECFKNNVRLLSEVRRR